jgi:N-acetylneuraminic acid mutarotase
MTFKMKQLFLLLLILTINIVVFQCLNPGGNNVVTTGGSEVWGKVVNDSGKAVSHVVVKLYEKNGEKLWDEPARVDTTDVNGKYLFKDVSVGFYVVQGFDTVSGSNTTFLHRGIEHDTSNKHSTDLKTDTLRLPGKLLVILKNAPGKFDGKTGYLPGAPYFTIAINDTLRLHNVACGKYICKFEQVEGYEPVVTDSFLISSGNQTVITIDLKIDHNGPPPAPQNLKFIGIIDTILGKAVLIWDSVKVSDLKTYVVYRGINADVLELLHSTVKTIDTVDLIVDTSGTVVTNYFQVEAKDNGGNESSSDTIIHIDAPSPQIVKTQISKTIVSPHAPLLYIGDTARIIVSLKNAGRIIDSVTWALGKSDSIVKKVRFGGTTQQCSDTMIMVWKDSSMKTWYISAYDNSGSKVSIVEQVNGLGYQPDTWQIFQAPNPKSKQALTVVSDGKTIFLLGGYTSKITEPGQTGVKTGTDTITYFSPDSFDGYHYAKMRSPHHYHSSVLYNGKIYSIGGIVGKKCFSTIEMFDPVTNLSVTVDTLPYVRYSASVVVYGSSFIITGGIFKPHPDSTYSITGLIDKYDVSLLAKGVEPLSTLGTMFNARKNHSSVVCGSKLVIMGGYDSTEQSIIRDVESMDLETNAQEVLTSMNTARSFFAAAAISDKVYVFGGWGDDSKGLKTVETYDMKKPSGWKFVSSMKNERCLMGAVVFNNKIYLAGGATNNNGTETDSTISIYNP